MLLFSQNFGLSENPRRIFKRAFAISGVRPRCPLTICVFLCVPSLKRNKNHDRSETSVREKTKKLTSINFWAYLLECTSSQMDAKKHLQNMWWSLQRYGPWLLNHKPPWGDRGRGVPSPHQYKYRNSKIHNNRHPLAVEGVDNYDLIHEIILKH